MAELRALVHEAGGTRILDGISLAFRPHRFNVILGPNGAGKSTLLRIAAGLLRPTAGEVRYGERRLASFDAVALARKRAVLSQHIELAFGLCVEEVVLMGRYPHFGRTPSARDREIVARSLALVGMESKRAQQYRTLSGGERQKVQLARVLAQIWVDDPGEHRYLFLDEPTTSLDIRYRIQILDIVRDLLRRDITVVAVLHDLNTAFQYGDSFFILSGGRLVHEVDRADDVPAGLIERVFGVRAHRIDDAATGAVFWRFGLSRPHSHERR